MRTGFGGYGFVKNPIGFEVYIKRGHITVNMGVVEYNENESVDDKTSG